MPRCMDRATLDLRIDYPHATQLITREVRIQMMLADQHTVRYLGAVQGITVGGHQQFLLAEQFEVVAIERAEEHVDLVVAAQIVGADTWRVIAQIGCAPRVLVAAAELRSEEHTSE